jgi:hypothetical protein
MNDAAGPRTEAGKTLLKTVDYHIDSDEGDGCQWLHLGGKPCNCGLVEAIQDIEQEATRRDSPPDAEQPLSDLEQRQNEARRRDRQAHYDKGFSDGSRATAANAEALTRDQDAAVLALREALARWLPLSQNPSIAEEWPDKYLDLVWGPNGDKANTYGQLRADLRLLSDHSAAADAIRERVERLEAIVRRFHRHTHQGIWAMTRFAGPDPENDCHLCRDLVAAGELTLADIGSGTREALLSDHSAAAKQIEDEIRERVETLESIAAEARRLPCSYTKAEHDVASIDGPCCMLGVEFHRLATQQPAEGGDG